MSSYYRINPLSFIFGNAVHFQKNGGVHIVRLNRLIGGLLARFYRLPTLAPQAVLIDEEDAQPLVRAGLLIAVERLDSFLRREGKVAWWPGDKCSIHYMLGCLRMDGIFWFEHNGRVPLLFFSLGRATSASRPNFFVYDGVSFSFEDPSASALAGNKAATHAVLQHSGHLVPSQVAVHRRSIPNAATDRAKRILLSEVLQQPPAGLCFPLVVKPVNQSAGRGVVFARDAAELASALVSRARQFPLVPLFVIETAIRGPEWRVSVYADGSHAAYKRVCFSVCGDGRHTIRELVESQNRKRRRFVERRGYVRSPSRLRLGASEKLLLGTRQLTEDSLLKRGRRVVLAARPNFTLGGVFFDVTTHVPQRLLDRLQEVREQMGLTRAGFDLIGKLSSGFPYIIEVNSRPDIWPHVEPDRGRPRYVTERILTLGMQRVLGGAAADAIRGVCQSARATTLLASDKEQGAT